MATSTLPVSEVFGPTLQGEAPHGRLQPVLHLVRHPLLDRHAWYPAICRSAHNAGGVLQQIPDGAMVVVTGGEPGIHYSNPTFQALLQQLVYFPSSSITGRFQAFVSSNFLITSSIESLT